MIQKIEHPVLFLDHISKSYKKNRDTAFTLENFMLQLNAGELIRLRGRSGSGKTTLLRIAGLLTKPDSGDVYICGEAPCKETHRDILRSKYIGIVFQENYLFKHLTLLENLQIADLGAYHHARYEQLLTQFDINYLANVKAARLSGGELQRAGICRAIINEPKLLLLDEPTSALDDEAAAGVRKIIGSMQEKGVAILLASHDQRLDGLETRSVFLQ